MSCYFIELYDSYRYGNFLFEKNVPIVCFLIKKLVYLQYYTVRGYYRLFAFWDKTDKTETVVISTHGIINKIDKTPQSEIDKAERLRIKYFEGKSINIKNKKNENI